MTTQEATGWRDVALRDRQMEWGAGGPRCDIDHLIVEYDWGVPMALVEYKTNDAEYPKKDDWNRMAVAKLGDMAGLPSFCCQYTRDWLWWRLTPWNELAKKWIPTQRVLDERQYVQFQYKLRGKTAPEEILATRKVNPATDQERKERAGSVYKVKEGG